MPIDLAPFCATHPTAFDLEKPWSRGDWSYACNGSILVRVPRRDDLHEGGYVPSNSDALIDERLDRALALSDITAEMLPDGETDAECTWCKGHGRPARRNCPVCLGVGRERVPCPVRLGRASIDLGFLRLIAALPSARIEHPVEPTRAVAFAFSDGEGVVMPARVADLHKLPTVIGFSGLPAKPAEEARARALLTRMKGEG